MTMLPDNMRVTWERHVRCRFPDLSIGLLLIRGVKVRIRDETMDEFIRIHEEMLRQRFDLRTLKDEALIRRYRDFFWRMGIDPTKKRPASEALLRRILRGRRLPSINTVVDAYNLASAETLVTMSAYDLARMKPPLYVRFAKKGERVTLIGERMLTLSGKELVLTDREGILCVYVHGDVERTKVTERTKDVLLVAYGAPGINPADLERALTVAAKYVITFSGGIQERVRLFRASV